MFVIQRVRRDEDGHIVEVEGFARTASGDVASQSFGCPISELVSRIKCGDPVLTLRGGQVKTRRVSPDLETIEDLPTTPRGARLSDLPSF